MFPFLLNCLASPAKLPHLNLLYFCHCSSHAESLVHTFEFKVPAFLFCFSPDSVREQRPPKVFSRQCGPVSSQPAHRGADTSTKAVPAFKFIITVFTFAFCTTIHGDWILVLPKNVLSREGRGLGVIWTKPTLKVVLMVVSTLNVKLKFLPITRHDFFLSPSQWLFVSVFRFRHSCLKFDSFPVFTEWQMCRTA